jgi:hypothetical protein
LIADFITVCALGREVPVLVCRQRNFSQVFHVT